MAGACHFLDVSVVSVLAMVNFIRQQKRHRLVEAVHLYLCLLAERSSGALCAGLDALARSAAAARERQNPENEQ